MTILEANVESQLEQEKKQATVSIIENVKKNCKTVPAQTFVLTSLYNSVLKQFSKFEIFPNIKTAITFYSNFVKKEKCDLLDSTHLYFIGTITDNVIDFNDVYPTISFHELKELPIDKELL